MRSFFILIFSLIVLFFELHPITARAGTSLFQPRACHPQVTRACPLYFYLHNSNQGIAPYPAVAAYYRQVAPGLILENQDPLILQNSAYQNLSDQDRNHLSFRFDLNQMTFEPIQNVSAESVQKLFRFNAPLFVQKMAVGNFNDAILQYYASVLFNREKLNFEREILLPTDWRSLIHPPFFNLNEFESTPLPSQRVGRSPASSSPLWDVSYQQTMDQQTQTELTQGNQFRLMVNNASYQEKIRLVEGAKEYVFVAVMTFADSEYGEPLMSALIQKAKEGVDVRVIVEKVWTKIAFRKTLKKLQAGGVKVALANNLLRLGKKQGLFHSKYFIIDGKAGVAGGQNLIDRSHRATGYNHFNKDTDVRLEGPILTDMMEDYARLWERFTKTSFPQVYKSAIATRKNTERAQRLRGTENYPNWVNQKSPGLCRFVSQGPHTDKYKVSKAYYETFSRARDRIFMTTQIVNFQSNPLFKVKWSTKIYEKLFEKARSGVLVDLITNGIDGGFLKMAKESQFSFINKITKKITALTGYLNTLLRRKKQEIVASVPNINVWQHFQYIHSKVAVVDHTVSAIGSYNFENFSAESSYETAVFCQDAALTEALENDLVLTIGNSVPLISENQ